MSSLKRVPVALVRMALRSALLFTVAAGSATCTRSEVGGSDVVDVVGDAPSSPPRAPAAPQTDAGNTSTRLEPDAASLPLGSCAGPEGKTLRTLIVGNSQIYFWDLPKLLSDLSRSSPPACPRIAAEGFTRGGQNLKRLWEDGDSKGRDLARTIEDGRFDVVVIAESIDLVELPPPKTQFVTYAKLIASAAHASGARPVLYATPYVDQKGHFGFAEMAAPQIELARALAITIAAGGLAWLRVWKEMPDVFLHHPDHSHPGYKGSIISAMVIYAAITRATPIGLMTNPPIDCEGRICTPVTPLTPEEGALFQKAAWEEAIATGIE